MTNERKKCPNFFLYFSQVSDINDVSWFADSDTYAYSDPTWVV